MPKCNVILINLRLISVKLGRLEVIKQSSFSAYGDDNQIFYANKEAMKI